MILSFQRRIIRALAVEEIPRGGSGEDMEAGLEEDSGDSAVAGPEEEARVEGGRNGEMAERSNVPPWKGGVLERVPRVRIPLSPQ